MAFKVVILSANATNLVACIYSVLGSEPSLRPSDIIVVDDGCEVCAERLPPGIQWVDGVKPFVFARNANIGIRAAGGADVLLLNDDARLVTWRGFSRMAEETAKCPSVALVCPAVRGFCGNARQHEGATVGMTIEPERLCFVAAYIPAATTELIGELDERFVGYGYEDNDYCVRARMAGKNLAIYGDCVVEHGSLDPTFRSADNLQEMVELGRTIYRDKWSGGMVFPEKPTPTLSILIPSLDSRAKVRNVLLQHLNTLRAQLPDPWAVEILLHIDQKQKTVGQKRTELAWRARGAYAAYVDDDDQVDYQYLTAILGAIRDNPGVDTVCFDAWVTWEGKRAGRAVFDMAWGAYSNEDDTESGLCLYKRTPNHLCATRTELVRRIGFHPINRGEDTDYAQRLLPLLKSQVRIDWLLYLYQYSPTLTETQQPEPAPMVTPEAMRRLAVSA